MKRVPWRHGSMERSEKLFTEKNLITFNFPCSTLTWGNFHISISIEHVWCRFVVSLRINDSNRTMKCSGIPVAVLSENYPLSSFFLSEFETCFSQSQGQNQENLLWKKGTTERGHKAHSFRSSPTFPSMFFNFGRFAFRLCKLNHDPISIHSAKASFLVSVWRLSSEKPDRRMV